MLFEWLFEIYLKYDEYIDPSFWVSPYSFVRTNDCIAYNQPIDNRIYLFDKAGNLKDCIEFDFKEFNVKDEDKVNIEYKLDDYDRYYFIRYS